MPLVLPGGETVEEPRDERHARLRKIRPEFADGPLVTVAGARHLAEAELIQGLLLEEGVPSVLKRTAGFDVPDFLAAGPRDVLVPQTGASFARELLLGTELAPTQGDPPARRPVLLALVVGGGAALCALLAWLLIESAG
ncbi:MAG TPA: hypothetical protein VK304_11595 [Thermoleophilaceae bacterium]|nr:hypothetical protein [Thermoleophilaceae bacterium]